MHEESLPQGAIPTHLLRFDGVAPTRIAWPRPASQSGSHNRSEVR
jgi:hypothetical protein